MSRALNHEQQEAVRHPLDRPLKVIAGAGTGKTTLLVARYLRALADGIPPDRLLALTFTNKAAGEMMERLSVEVPGFDPAAAWVTTFHAFALRLLKGEALWAGIDPRFTIMDETGSRLAFERAYRDLLSGRFMDPAFEPERLRHLRFDRASLAEDLYGIILRLKDAAVSPEDFLETCRHAHPAYRMKLIAGLRNLPPRACRSLDAVMGRLEKECEFEDELAGAIFVLYKRYQKELDHRRALDFGDLIARAVAVLELHPERRRHYQERFRHILVDEFQDTSEAQFSLVRLLAVDEHLSNVTVVGDDKQSIYGWRNARVENVRDFDAPSWGGRALTANRNYRSTKEILEVASHAIAQSPYFAGRPQETVLLAEGRGSGGSSVFVFRGPGSSEAAFIAGQIGRLLQSGFMPEDVVILLRSLRGVKSYEDTLQKAGIPYAAVGGMGFYDREEIKDIISFLRLAEDPLDDTALLRVLTRAPFALSDCCLSAFAGQQGPGDEFHGSLYDRIGHARMVPEFEGRKEGLEILERFEAVLKELQRIRDAVPLQEVIMQVLQVTGYARLLDLLDENERSRSRANLQKLGGMVSDFARANPGAGLQEFLVRIQSAVDYNVVEGQADPNPGGAVRLMTIHQAKGLEFPVVFVAGVAPGRFPSRFHRPRLSFDPTLGLIISRMADKDTQKSSPQGYGNYREVLGPDIRSPLEEARSAQKDEERRLWYVALTRAKSLLFLSGPPEEDKDRGEDYLSEVIRLLQEHPEIGRAIETPIQASEAEMPFLRPAEVAATRERPSIRRPVLPPMEHCATRSVELSFSALRIFMHCPSRYYFLNRWGFPSAGTGKNSPLGYQPALLGNAVHRALERGRHSEPGYVEPFIQSCLDFGLDMKAVRGVYLPMAKPWLEAFSTSRFGRAVPGERWEQEFCLDLMDEATRIRFRGFIDHLIPAGEGHFELIDYKTNRALGPNELIDYALQLQWYALACREAMGYVIDRLWLYHLPSERMIEISKDPGALEEARGRLVAAARSIARGELHIENQLAGRGCRHCPVRACPEFGRDEPDISPEAWEDESIIGDGLNFI